MGSILDGKPTPGKTTPAARDNSMKTPG